MQSPAFASLSQLVAAVTKSISAAHEAEEVVAPLHSLASLLHSCLPAPARAPGSSPSSLEIAQLASSCIEEACRISGNHKSTEVLKSLFYGSSLFPAFAKTLLYHVAPDWLACFSPEEQVNLFDSFFRLAPSTEPVLSLVPALTSSYTDVDDGRMTGRDTTCGVAERLLVLCLFKDGGLKKAVIESAVRINTGGILSGAQKENSGAVQLIASIPDRVRPGALSDLRSPHFHLSSVCDCLEAIEEYWTSNLGSDNINKAPFVQAGELFSRFCRRGHADVVASLILSKMRGHIEQNHAILGSATYKTQMVAGIVDATSESYPQPSFWKVLMMCIKDVYGIERLAKALLLEMAEKQVKDDEAYDILHMLFFNLLENTNSIRSLFTERFLVWTVLPVCCLRWILQFAVFRSAFGNENHTSKINLGSAQRAVIRHLVEVWSEEKFIQAGDMQLQSYVTTAVGLSLRAITKEELERTNNLLQLLLQGISRRLESPLDLVRMMAKKIALAFSLVIDQKNPLLLDETDKIEDLCDWETCDMRMKAGSIEGQHLEQDATLNNKISETKVKKATDNAMKKKKKHEPVSEAFDPDEVIDLRTYTSHIDDNDDDSFGGSDSESVCSIQPYSLSDDESDLQREKFPMQLNDCCVNLRKGDQPELVERTLDVIEKLIRATPEELENVASDLAHALIHVRCSDIVVEGQEDTAEKKRYNALVALLACAPATVEMFARELYSPHMDISQRLLVLEVMSDAARELATLSFSGGASGKLSVQSGQPAIEEMDRTWYGPGSNFSSIGASPWRQVHEPNAMVSLIHKYEREVPYQLDEFKPLGKARRWGHKSMELRREQYNHSNYKSVGRNNFVPYAGAFMLPIMRDYDKIQHGVDFLGRDFIVLGRLICMLGVCVECVSLQPEAVILASALLDMLRSRKISLHPEIYVKRAILYAASRVMISLHPSQVMHSENTEILGGLDWIRSWALKVTDEDTDAECSSMALACLHIHSELLLQASRSIEIQDKNKGPDITYKVKDINLDSTISLTLANYPINNNMF